MKLHKKKPFKKQIKQPDEFMTVSARLLEYILQNRKQISIGAGVVLAALIIFSSVLYIMNRSEDKAFAMFESAMSTYDNVSTEKSPEEAYGQVAPDFEALLSRYAGKDAVKYARVSYANICYEAGEIDKAIELYQKALSDFSTQPALKNMACNGLAYAYEAKGDYPNAIKYFEQITASSTPAMKDGAYYNLGRLYAKIGETEKSRKAYETIEKDYADFIYIDLVKAKLAG